MFGRQKPAVLSATLMLWLEMIRQAIEVLTGKRTCFIHMDFGSGQGKVRVGEEVKELSFQISRSDLIFFELDRKSMNDRYVGLFRDGEVFVANEYKAFERKTIAGVITMRWVGKSATERREEPLFS
jgi:hypothetical protein